MDTPGNLLRTKREEQKKSLNDIEDLLKINIEYLRAIEEDEYERLPGDIFTRSYLRSYAGALGIEPDHVLRLYKSGFVETSAAPQPPRRPVHDMLSRLKPVYIYLIPACIILAVILAAVYTQEDGGTKSGPAPEVEEHADSVTEKTGGEIPPPAEKAAPEKPVTETSPAETDAGEERYTLTITAGELTWVSIRKDSGPAEELLLRTGESRTVTAQEKFVIKVGNAGGTSLELNGRDIGPLGPRGQVAEITLP